MAINDKIVLIRGKIYWAKILGDPIEDKFRGSGWAFDLEIDDETKAMLLGEGVSETKFKSDEDRPCYLQFWRNAIRKDGTPGKPFSIVDCHKKPWNNDTLIGNGSVVNVQCALKKWSMAGRSGVKPNAIALQIWDLVEYESNGFSEKSADEETFGDDMPNW